MLRAYEAEDAGAVVSLWNAAVTAEAEGKDWYVESNRLSEQKLGRIGLDPNFDPGGAVVYENQGEVVGYVRGVVKTIPAYEGEPLAEMPAYLEGLVVAKSFRGQGIGTRLLQHAESFARARRKGVLRAACFQSAIAGVSMLPGSSGYVFLVSRGYEPEPHEMRLELKFQNFSLRDEIVKTRERLRGEGIEIKYYGAGYRGSFQRLMETEFTHWWHFIYRPNLDRDDPLPVLIATDGDRVVGFVGFVHVSEDGRAGFTPGVDPDYRRRGIGEVLVNLWGAEAKDRGAEKSLISTGTTNYPAQCIYFGMGYRKLGEFSRGLTKRLW